MPLDAAALHTLHEDNLAHIIAPRPRVSLQPATHAPLKTHVQSHQHHNSKTYILLLQNPLQLLLPMLFLLLQRSGFHTHFDTYSKHQHHIHETSKGTRMPWGPLAHYHVSDSIIQS